jgi:flagellar biosynthetic protein FliO
VEIIRYLASFTLVVALLLGLLYLLKKLQTGSLLKSRPRRLELAETLILSSKTRLILVRIGARELLLGTTPTHISRLSEWRIDAHEAEATPPKAQTTSTAVRSPE